MSVAAQRVGSVVEPMEQAWAVPSPSTLLETVRWRGCSLLTTLHQ